MLNEEKSFTFNNLICFIAFIISIIVSFLLVIDGNKPEYYSLLFLLPLIFGVMSIVCKRIYIEIPSNLGITILVVLLFARLVISPLFMFLGNYEGTITLGIEYNTPLAIFLVLYETFAIFLLLYFQSGNKKDDAIKEKLEYNNGEIKRYLIVVAALCFIALICYIITPELGLTYRTLEGMTNKDFTTLEDAYIVDTYGTTFIKKLSLVTGQYLVRGLSVIVPAVLIGRLSKNKCKRNRIISLLCCLIPLLFIGGAIARSLIYVVCLYLFYNFVFFGKLNVKTIIFVLGLAGIGVILWWIIRGEDEDLFAQFSRRFSAYFSGVNVVSGVGNLPNSYEFKARYFLYDFIGSVPYGGTLFNISSERIQSFFNAYNQSQGQIPPTIAMSYYYFGLVLSPVYSLFFALIVVKAGKKLKKNIYGSRMKYIRLLLTVFYFSMGIVMYNIEIIMTNFFSVLLPMIIIESISYKKLEKENDS